MNTTEIHESRIIKKRGISLIWILPVIAVALAGWLVFDQLSNRGIMITIQFDSGTGLEAGKTKVKYKGIVAGVVKKVDLSEDFQSVTATVEIIKEAEEVLKAETRFRLVKPEVSLSKISGLETLFSGEYIAIMPSLEGEPTRHFTALNKPLPPAENGQGLTLTLYSDKARSIGIGSFVTYREFKVGEVYDYELSDDAKTVLIHIYIKKEYVHLVKKNTRFWNSSGIDVNVSFPAVTIRTDSLFSLISGGISLSTPDESGIFEQAVSDDRFKLYEDYDTARHGISVSISFKDAEGLSESTPVLLNGVKIGTVEKMAYDENYTGAVVEAVFDTGTEHFLNTGTLFWLVKPELTLSGPRGFDAIIKGNYIAMKPGKGKPIRKFSANASEPADRCGDKGLMLCLKAASLTVHEDAPVMYKKVPVGSVIRYKLSKKGETVDLQVQISDEYAHLVNPDSRFYSTGGIRFKGNAKEVSVEADNLISVALGGISFFTPKASQNKKIDSKNCPCFPLYKNLKEATNNGRLLIKDDTKSLYITVIDHHSTGVTEGSPLLYKKMEVGEVLFSNLSPKDDIVRIHIRIRPEFKHLVKKNSRFWNASGIDVKGGLAGISLRTESLTSIALGGIAFFNPNGENAKTAKSSDSFPLHVDYDSAKNRSKTIKITFQSADGLAPGAILDYKGIKLGQIDKIDLNPGHKTVIVSVELFEKGLFAAKKDSRFWIVKPVLGISGVENLKTMVTGNYLSVLPGKGDAVFSFTGLSSSPELPETSEGLPVKLVATDLGSLSLGSPVYYKQVPVGSVSRYELDQENDRVIITAMIDIKYAQLVRAHSKFWNVSGIDIDFGLVSGLKMETRSAAAVLLGGVAFTNPGGAKSGDPAASGARFTLFDEYQKKWAK